MAKKDSRFIRRIFILLGLVLNTIVGVALLFSFFAQFITPAFTIVFTYAGLAFPYLLFANLFFVLYWVFIKYQYSFISLFLLLLNVNNIDKYFQFSGLDKPEKCANCVKVMSYNAKLFGVYNSDNPAVRERESAQVFSFLQNVKPDIVCFQEFFHDKSGKLGINTVDSVLSVMKLNKKTPRETRQHYATYYPAHLRNEYYFGLAIFSKYKILHAEPVQMPDSLSTNGALYADIKYKNDTVRIYCLHLESFKMDKVDYELGRMIIDNNINDPDFNKKAMKISDKMSVAFRKRARQADAVRAHIDSCRYPVIVCGDFNDTPISYSYNRIARGLKDTFRTSGKGEAVTYHGDAFPSYRIDYILHHRKFNSYGHTVCDSITVSDHYPVYSYITIQKR